WNRQGVAHVVGKIVDYQRRLGGGHRQAKTANRVDLRDKYLIEDERQGNALGVPQRLFDFEDRNMGFAEYRGDGPARERVVVDGVDNREAFLRESSLGFVQLHFRGPEGVCPMGGCYPELIQDKIPIARPTWSLTGETWIGHYFQPKGSDAGQIGIS